MLPLRHPLANTPSGPRTPFSACHAPPQVVLGTPKAKASTPDILAVHCIAADRSPDLMQGGQGQGQAGGQSGVNGQANGPVKDGEGAGAGEAEDEDGGDKGKEKEKGAKGGKGGKASGKAKR